MKIVLAAGILSKLPVPAGLDRVLMVEPHHVPRVVPLKVSCHRLKILVGVIRGASRPPLLILILRDHAQSAGANPE